jgi:Pyridoxamine 5'-phosphate oxidase
MAKVFEAIDEHLQAWIARQPMFFVATAPAGADGHVNVSPKGPIGTLKILGPLEVAYLDAHGSGSETIAHLRDNGRIVVMFCAFQGPPRILRLHGRGEVVLPEDDRFAALLERCAFDDLGPPESRRSIIRVDLERVADSCGYGVPLMAYEGMREHYGLSVGKKVRTMGADGYARMTRERGERSIDGLPALPPLEFPVSE